MRNFILGLIAGLSLMAFSANAGIISHVVAYKIGQSSGKKQVQQDCICPPATTRPGGE